MSTRATSSSTVRGWATTSAGRSGSAAGNSGERWAKSVEAARRAASTVEIGSDPDALASAARNASTVSGAGARRAASAATSARGGCVTDQARPVSGQADGRIDELIRDQILGGEAGLDLLALA